MRDRDVLRTDAVRESLIEEVKFEMGGKMGGPGGQEMSEESNPLQAVSWSRAVVVAAVMSLTTLTL